MLRMMIAACLCLAAMPLAGCATSPNPCAGASARRTGYVAAIAAAHLYAASGRPRSDAVDLGRQAAATALMILDARCPSVR